MFSLKVTPPPIFTLFPYTTLFRSRCYRPLRSAPLRGDPLSVFDHARFEPFTDQANDPLIGDPMFEKPRSEEHTSELQSHHDLVCRLLLEKKNRKNTTVWLRQRLI